MRSNLADECIDAVRARLLSFAGMSTHGAANAASTADVLQVAGCNSSGQLYHRETSSDYYEITGNFFRLESPGGGGRLADHQGPN